MGRIEPTHSKVGLFMAHSTAATADESLHHQSRKSDRDGFAVLGIPAGERNVMMKRTALLVALGLTAVAAATPIIALALNQPTNVHAVRVNGSAVKLTWSEAPSADLGHLNVMTVTSASAPAPNAPGWSKYSSVAPTAPERYTLSSAPAPAGQHNWFMVCAADNSDKNVDCSAPAEESTN